MISISCKTEFPVKWLNIVYVFIAEYKPNSLTYNQQIVNKSNVAETLTQVCVALKHILK